MNFEDLKKHAERDMKVDDTQLDLESLKIPQLHNKYLNFLQEERFNLKKMGFDFDSLRRSKWEYYTGKMSEEDLNGRGWEPFNLKILKSDIPMYLDADQDVILLKQKITYQEEKVFYLESVLKEIGQRNWEIRNAIEWRKFVSGS